MEIRTPRCYQRVKEFSIPFITQINTYLVCQFGQAVSRGHPALGRTKADVRVGQLNYLPLNTPGRHGSRFTPQMSLARPHQSVLMFRSVSPLN